MLGGRNEVSYVRALDERSEVVTGGGNVFGKLIEPVQLLLP